MTFPLKNAGILGIKKVPLNPENLRQSSEKQNVELEKKRTPSKDPLAEIYRRIMQNQRERELKTGIRREAVLTVGGDCHDWS